MCQSRQVQISNSWISNTGLLVVFQLSSLYWNRLTILIGVSELLKSLRLAFILQTGMAHFLPGFFRISGDKPAVSAGFCYQLQISAYGSCTDMLPGGRGNSCFWGESVPGLRSSLSTTWALLSGSWVFDEIGCLISTACHFSGMVCWQCIESFPPLLGQRGGCLLGGHVPTESPMLYLAITTGYANPAVCLLRADIQLQDALLEMLSFSEAVLARFLAGPLQVLHRQIMLPGVSSLYAGHEGYLDLQCDTELEDFGASAFHATLGACRRRHLHLDGCHRDGQGPSCQNCLGHSQKPGKVAWVHRFRGPLEKLIDAGLDSLLALLVATLVELGCWALACFRTGCLLTFCYLCRLLLFGWNLKGGVCNWDNLLRIMRSSASAVPWQLAVGLNAFSPRLSSSVGRRGGKRRTGFGFSVDLFLLLILVATLIGPVAAANDRRPPAHPPEFPRAPTFQEEQVGDRGLLGDPDIAQELVPNLVVPQAPPVVYVYRAFKLYGFGRQPEFISCANTQNVNSQRCLELLGPDVDASRTGGRGALHYLRGPAVIDELQAQWIPSWVHSALGRIIVIDASLLGYTPFQAYIRDGIVSYARINLIMPELADREYYIFVPAQDADPIAYEGYPSRMIIDNGDVIHLTPDPAPPQAVNDVRWAFDHF